MRQGQDSLRMPIKATADHTRPISLPKAGGAGPVVWWASAGVVSILVQTYVYGSWLISGEATKTPTGSDPVPDTVKLWAWVFQTLSISALIILAVYCVRRCRREGRLTFDAMLAIALPLTFWMDTAINYLRPIWAYNSYLVNLGAWNLHIPGWISPHGNRVPEPLLMSLPVYGPWFVTFAALFCWLARRAHARNPNFGKVRTFLLGVVVLAVLDTVLELFFIRGEIWAYTGVIREFSLFPGERYQFPIYEALFIGVFCSILGMLRYYRDDRGLTRIERGVDDLRISQRKRSLVSALAFIGLANGMMVVLNIGYNWAGLYADETPVYPSYLVNGLCGPGTGYECPAPDVPVYSRDTPPRPDLAP